MTATSSGLCSLAPFTRPRTTNPGPTQRATTFAARATLYLSVRDSVVGGNRGPRSGCPRYQLGACPARLPFVSPCPVAPVPCGSRWPVGWSNKTDTTPRTLVINHSAVWPGSHQYHLPTPLGPLPAQTHHRERQRAAPLVTPVHSNRATGDVRPGRTTPCCPWSHAGPTTELPSYLPRSW